MNKKKLKQHLEYEAKKEAKRIKEYSEKILKIFPGARDVSLWHDGFSFKIDNYNESQVTFVNLAKLSEAFETDLINIRGDADSDYDTCCTEAYCEIRVRY
jgi:hypothetical protein